MNINFSAWSIHRPTPAILLFFIASVAGLLGFRSLQIASMPDFDFPGIEVGVSLPGATPSQLETEVTRKIEDATASIPGVRHLQSTITDGFSSTFIEFQLEKDIQEALDEVRDAVTGVRSALPADVREPSVSRVSINGGSIATYAVRARNMDPTDLSWFIDNTVSKAIMPIKGVGEFRRYGGVSREVRVMLDPVKLAAYGVTAGEISQRLGTTQQESPGGRSELGGQEQAVRTIATVGSVEALAAMSFALADGRRVRLDQLARVEDTAAEQRQAGLLDGQPGLSFRIYRTRGSAEAEVAQAVEAAVAALAQAHPDIAFDRIYTTVGPIVQQYEASMQALLEGAILAVIVVMLFLRDWRATLVSAVALPLSIIPTFAFIHWAGFTLNTITLLALTLVIGILVDDAIVEVENIMRHLRMGKSAKQAALDAADEIGLAVIATSLTLVSVFLPVALMPGISGLIFQQFGWTASIAILASLVVARLLTPMMAAYMLRNMPLGSQPEHDDGWVMRHYLGATRACLRHPVLTCLGAALFFALAMAAGTTLPTTFVSADDDALTVVTVEAPPGSRLPQTEALAEAVRQRIQPLPEVLRVYTMIGNGVSAGSSGSGGDISVATLIVVLSDVLDRERSQQEVEADMRRRLADVAGARISVGGDGNGNQLQLQLSSEDPLLLEATAENVLREIRSVPGTGGAISSASLLRPELVIRPDFERAAELGVTAAAIGAAIRVATAGDYDVSLPKLNLPERQLFIRTQLDPASRSNLDQLAQLRVPTATGSVPLAHVAQLSIEGGPAQIQRYDRARNITLSVRLQGRALGDVYKDIQQLPSMKNLPPQVRPASGGDAEIMQEMMTNFAVAMLTGIFCVYAVMVLLFHGFAQPITVLAALPLAAGGAVGSLMLFQMELSLATLIGLLMLIGIVSKNSILLVEYAITARVRHGLSRTEAILDACHKRARPIVMTTVAMGAGMLPMALDLSGTDSGFRSPMAVVVIGGLITSTALSLVVVPVVYEIIDSISVGLGRIFGKHTPPTPALAPIHRS